MNIFNSNKKLEELTIETLDFNLFIRSELDSNTFPSIILYDGEKQHIRRMITNGDPIEYAKEILKDENVKFQQFVIVFEGFLRDENNNRTDAIIVHGFDVTQDKGTTLGQMFVPKEKGVFKKLGKAIFLGNPDLIIPKKEIENPIYDIDEIGINVMTLTNDKNKKTIDYVVIITHDSPSQIALEIKRFLRNKFTSDNAIQLSGFFKFIVTEPIKDIEFLKFIIKYSFLEELSESTTQNWQEEFQKPLVFEVIYNDETIFKYGSSISPKNEIKPKVSLSINSKSDSENIGNNSLTEQHNQVKEEPIQHKKTKKKWWQFWK